MAVWHAVGRQRARPSRHWQALRSGSTNPYDGFFPGRKWEPVSTEKFEEGEARRQAAALRRQRWQRRQQRGPASQVGASIGVVCHGNIARSQVFAHFLDAGARASLLPLDVFSCGTAAEQEYPNSPALVAETERRLALVTPPGVTPPQLTRDYWSPAVEARLRSSTLIVTADASLQVVLRDRLGSAAPEVKLFYELCQEGAVDFVDTYDAATGGQDPDRYNSCFAELERMAGKAVGLLLKREEQLAGCANGAADDDDDDDDDASGDSVAMALLAVCEAEPQRGSEVYVTL